MGWTGYQGELEMFLETCVLAALDLHSVHDPLPVHALQFPWFYSGTCESWAGDPYEMQDVFSSQ